MQLSLIPFALIAIALRLMSVAISQRHERALKQDGAVEHGALNSKLLALAHLAFYIAAIVEGWVRGTTFDALSTVGIIIYGAGMLMLVWVIRVLGRFWTVKLLIARDHVLLNHPLFRLFRHPNYFLNIIPELVGFSLIFHAYVTLMIGLPIYLVPLVIRIRQEDQAMRQYFT
jgi:isoprenylcysteine carboxyl methyltransferase (ICMT) family protein YpbQ